MNMAFRRCARVYRFPANFLQYSTRIQVEIDPLYIKEGKKTSFTHHSGLSQVRNVQKLPQDIEKAITIAIKEESTDLLIKDGYAFVRHLHSRLSPLEYHEKSILAKEEEYKMEKKLLEKEEKLSPEALQKFKAKAPSLIKRQIKARENLWTPTTYTDHRCFQYLLLRGPADYAVLNVILSDIARRDPDFQPTSVLDFGSGVGTVSWVIEKLWKTCKEFYNVDINSTMRDLAGLILKRGNPQSQLPPGIFFKGFLPSSLKHTHDIVVSAYTLLELDSRRQRLETLLTLWNKADEYLVIVEEGTRAGYKMVIEARDFILEMAERDQIANNGPGAYVFAPCPHERACPKFLTSKFPCNFEVYYSQHPSVQSTEVVRERYSYVVLKRGTRPKDEPSWPRIVEEMKVRTRHVMCRLCTPDGSLTNITLSKKKDSSGTYTLLKKSVWGDSVPFVLNECEKDQLSMGERRRLKHLESTKGEKFDEEDITTPVQSEGDEERKDDGDPDSERRNRETYNEKHT